MATAVLAVGAVAIFSQPALAGGSGTTLKLRRTNVGTILANARGFTVYAFTKDGRNRNACVAIRGCSSVWPAVSGGSRVTLGPGVRRALVGTITLPNGTKQLTYGGHPLYTYVADSGPGQTSYVNFLQFGGRWPAVDAAGRLIK